jgi:two-component system LytT family response regulator
MIDLSYRMRLVIAENNPGERAALVRLCQSHGGLGDPVVADSGADALEKIRLSRPDVVLLACELNDMTGFDVLRALGRNERPATIMVAPDARYAAEAFKSEVTDYLTTPVATERFKIAVERVCAASHNTYPAAAQELFSGALGAGRHPAGLPLGYGDRLVGERARRLYFLAPNDVDYIEADSNYIKICIGSDVYVNRDSLTRLSHLLESYGFARISRSVILNLRRVTFAERESSGILAFVLRSGQRVLSSSGYRLEFGTELRVVRSRGKRRANKTA